MRKRLPLQKGKRRPVLLPLLLGICCFGVLWIQGRTYYGETMALEHRLAGMQLPVLYGVPYSTPTPATVGTDIDKGVSEGIRVESLAILDGMEDGKIIFRHNA